MSLYAERFSRRGHQVTGIDFSANSIAYARAQAEKSGSGICLPEMSGTGRMLISTSRGSEPVVPTRFHFFQWLEKGAEKFPMVGKTEQKVSNDWKKRLESFQ